MKLIYKIVLQLLGATTILLTIWGIVFYMIVIAEVNDETDDNLEDYTENLLLAFNNGEELPSQYNGTNNSYYLEQISSSYIDINEKSEISEQEVYIAWKKETEPARIIKTTFINRDGLAYQLTVYTPTIEKDDLAESILIATISLIFLLLVTITLIFIILYRKNMSPLYNILTWLKSYKLGKTNRELTNPTNIAEFKLLNKAITDSIKSIEYTYNTSKEFTDNVSHELQTPIAICKNRTENLINKCDNEEILNELNKILSTLEYMKRLNKSILFLTRIENKQFSDVEIINCNTLVNDLLEDFAEIYKNTGITVDTIENKKINTLANTTLIKTLLLNLIKNAFIYSEENTKIRIKLSDNEIEISNQGDIILDIESLFKRFVRGTNLGKKNSTGLGLAICDAICKLYNFTLNYSFKNNHHIFTIKLK